MITRSRLRSLLLIVTVLSLSSVTITAFQPKSGYGHDFITRTALRATGFCRGTTEIIVSKNVGVDYGPEFFNSDAHCDSEHIEQCHDRIRRLVAASQDAAERAASISGGNLTSESQGVRANALESLGRLLHTLQDFYAHSNSIDSKPGPHPRFGHTDFENVTKVAASNDTVCSDKSHYLPVDLLTSGYFLYPNPCSAPEGKCVHGVDTKLLSCNGTNHDYPSRPGFDTARSSAIQATEELLQRFLSNLSSNAQIQMKGGETCGRDVAFVIDISGNLSQILPAVESAISHPTESQGIGRYLLSTFGSSTCGSAQVFSSQAAFVDALKVLQTNSSQTCPRAMMCGLLVALSQMNTDKDNLVFVISDGSAQDTKLLPQVLQQVSQKQAAINFLLAESCSGPFTQSTSPHLQRLRMPRRQPISISSADAVSLHLVEYMLQQTGPSNLPSLSSNESLPIIDMLAGGRLISGNLTDILPDLATLLQMQVSPETAGLLAGRGFLLAGACSNVSFPTDPTIKSMIVLLNFNESNGLVTAFLRDPLGMTIQANLTQSRSFIWNISQTPRPGDWQVNMCASPTLQSVTFSISAQGIAPIDVYDLEFGNKADWWTIIGSRHVTYSLVTGLPTIGDEYTYASAFLRGNASEVQSITGVFANLGQNLSDPFTLEIVGMDPNGFSSALSLQESKKLPPIPSLEPFYIRYFIQLKNGTKLFRYSIQEQTPSVLKITRDYQAPYVEISENPNTTTKITFTVHNYGPDDTLVLRYVVDPPGMFEIVDTTADAPVEVDRGDSVDVDFTLRPLRNDSRNTTSALITLFVYIQSNPTVDINVDTVEIRFAPVVCTNDDGVVCSRRGLCTQDQCICLPFYAGSYCDDFSLFSAATSSVSFEPARFTMMTLLLLVFFLQHLM